MSGTFWNGPSSTRPGCRDKPERKCRQLDGVQGWNVQVLFVQLKLGTSLPQHTFSPLSLSSWVCLFLVTLAMNILMISARQIASKKKTAKRKKEDPILGESLTIIVNENACLRLLLFNLRYRYLFLKGIGQEMVSFYKFYICQNTKWKVLQRNTYNRRHQNEAVSISWHFWEEKTR